MSNSDRKSAARAVLGGGSQGARRAKQQRPRIQAWLPDDETDERIRNAAPPAAPPAATPPWVTSSPKPSSPRSPAALSVNLE